MRSTILTGAASVLVMAVMSAGTPVSAQDYPARPIKLVVAFAPGGPNDTVGRIVAKAMSKDHTVFVENVSGAGGNIAATYVSRAAPDGYTLLFHQLGMAISPFLYNKLEYDPLNSFEYIGLVAYQANVLVTRPKFAPGSFQDFLKHLKANQHKLSFGSTGRGGASDLCGILFRQATGIEMTTVPYRTTSQALTDMMAGNVDLLCDSVATASSFIQSGAVEAHGVTTLTRAPGLPDVPTLDEQGLKGFDMMTWTAMYAPKNTPKPAVDYLVRSLQKALDDPELLASLKNIGSAPMPKARATPEGLSSFLRQEMKRWQPILQQSQPPTEKK